MSVPSPCRDVCKMHEATGLCEGCGRRIGEIAAWAQMDDESKLALSKLLPARRAELARVLFPDADPPVI